MSSPIQQLRAKFDSISPRERRLVFAAAAVVLIALVVTVAEWALRERVRLAHELPRAKAQLLQMQDDAAELTQLKRTDSVATRLGPDALAQSVDAAGRTRGLEIEVRPASGGVQVNGSGSFAAVMEWLAGVQAEHRLRPARVTLSQEGTVVRFDAALLP